MASGKREVVSTKQIVEVLQKVEVVKVIEEIVLRLTPDEAETLRFIGYRVGGSPEGRRGDIDNINAALSAAGVRDVDLNQCVDMEDCNGSYRSHIAFKATRTRRLA